METKNLPAFVLAGRFDGRDLFCGPKLLIHPLVRLCVYYNSFLPLELPRSAVNAASRMRKHPGGAVCM